MGFYGLFETFERITGRDFYSLSVSANREQSVPLAGEPNEFFGELSGFRDRFLETMDDDFNTGAGVGVLFEMRKCINGFVSNQKLDAGTPAASDVAALVTAATLLKELSALLGVFQKPIEKQSGGDDAFVASLMELFIKLRADARASKNFETADGIRDGLAALQVTLEDRPDGTIWRRE